MFMLSEFLHRKNAFLYYFMIQEPVKKEVSKHFGFCCWSSGPLTMTLSLPVSGYVPGQDIPITVDVENNSNVPIREVKCTLRKVREVLYCVFYFMSSSVCRKINS
jgi:hypothetical protein